MKSFTIRTITSLFFFLGAGCGVEVANVQPIGDEPTPCGGPDGAQCEGGFFCDAAEGASGLCVEIPTVCPAILHPVCGADGETYPNDCVRKLNEVSLAYDGSCEQIAGEGEACGGAVGVQCSGDLFCDTSAANDSCAVDATGICAVKPTICPDNFDQVCGCDGVTYSNECTMRFAGTSLAADGACQ